MFKKQTDRQTERDLHQPILLMSRTPSILGLSKLPQYHVCLPYLQGRSPVSGVQFLKCGRDKLTIIPPQRQLVLLVQPFLLGVLTDHHLLPPLLSPRHLFSPPFCPHSPPKNILVYEKTVSSYNTSRPHLHQPPLFSSSPTS